MRRLISNKADDAQLPKYLTKAEHQFAHLMEMDELDEHAVRHPVFVKEFENTFAVALESAFRHGAGDDHCHLFLQRILYRINRLKFFWYDELSNYKNESSDYLRGIRKRIEAVWAKWEISQLIRERIQETHVAEALRRRAAGDAGHRCADDRRRQVEPAGQRNPGRFHYFLPERFYLFFAAIGAPRRRFVCRKNARARLFVCRRG